MLLTIANEVIEFGVRRVPPIVPCGGNFLCCRIALRAFANNSEFCYDAHSLRATVKPCPPTEHGGSK